MIRAETPDAWLLVTHPDHAGLAGDFAAAWGNARFAAPEPAGPVHYAVRHHDDGWLARDAAPSLTATGKPEAFTKALVGAYSAFEEIDLPNYLRVRGQATAAVAAADRHAGIIVSMHTVNLLTEQADLATIRPEHRTAHAAFVTEQQTWQRTEIAALGLDPAGLQRAFEFLQACDNLSLIACSGYDEARDLRHTHPDRDGVRHTLRCTPAGPGTWHIAPWPFRDPAHTFTVPRRTVPKTACASPEAFRAAFATAAVETVTLRLVATP